MRTPISIWSATARRLSSLGAAALCLGWPVPTATAGTVANDGEMLVIEFSFTGPPAALVPPADLLALNLTGGASANVVETTYRLFDGATLLGETTRVGTFSFGGASFVSATNPFPEFSGRGASTVVDFTSILAGTIDGRIEMIPTFSGSGFVDVDVDLKLAHQTSASGFTPTDPPTIDSVSAIPIPTTEAPALNTRGLVALALTLTLFGAGALGWRRSRSAGR